MASITQITTIDGTTYDIRDAQARMYGVHYVEGNTNDTAGTWTGTLENLTAYYNGLTIIYVPKVAGASTTTLNLNSIGAITCYTTNTTKLDTQYTANTPILFTYQDGYWRRADNDVNTTTISNLYHHFGNYVADSAIYRYQILFERTEDKLTPLTNANNDTGTSKAMLTNVEFNAFGRIFYYVSATTVEANGSVSAGSLCFAHESFNARYTFNCGTTLTAHKNFYLVVTPTTGNMCTIASSSPWAQELPSTNDGNWYILIGRAYSTYQVSLYPLHPVYMYDGTKVIQVMPNGFTASEMKGATASVDGSSGLVPKPSSGDQTKYLRGDGTWQTVPGGGGATIDDTAGAGDTDKAWSADKLTTEFSETKIYTATCSSAGDASVKSIVCNDIPIVSLYGNDVIQPGTRLCVHFQNRNTYREPRLSVEVNGTAYEYPVFTIPCGGVTYNDIDFICGASSNQWNVIGARTSENIILSVFVYNISSLPLTVTCPQVTSYSVCIWNDIIDNGYGYLMKSDWEIRTSDGYFTITGTKDSGTFSANFIFYDLYNVNTSVTT